MQAQLTVKTAPTSTTTKLTDCCVARATFSPLVNSPHSYRPSSDRTVTPLLFGALDPFPAPSPVSLYVAYKRANCAVRGKAAEEVRKRAVAALDVARGRREASPLGRR